MADTTSNIEKDLLSILTIFANNVSSSTDNHENEINNTHKQILAMIANSSTSKKSKNVVLPVDFGKLHELSPNIQLAEVHHQFLRDWDTVTTEK